MPPVECTWEAVELPSKRVVAPRAVAPDLRRPDDLGVSAASEGIPPNAAATVRRRPADVDVGVPWGGIRPAAAVPFHRRWDDAGDAVPWDESRESAVVVRRRSAADAGAAPMGTPDVGVGDRQRGETDGGEGDCRP